MERKSTSGIPAVIADCPLWVSRYQPRGRQRWKRKMAFFLFIIVYTNEQKSQKHMTAFSVIAAHKACVPGTLGQLAITVRVPEIDFRSIHNDVI